MLILGCLGFLVLFNFASILTLVSKLEVRALVDQGLHYIFIIFFTFLIMVCVCNLLLIGFIMLKILCNATLGNHLTFLVTVNLTNHRVLWPSSIQGLYKVTHQPCGCGFKSHLRQGCRVCEFAVK